MIQATVQIQPILKVHIDFLRTLRWHGTSVDTYLGKGTLKIKRHSLF